MPEDNVLGTPPQVLDLLEKRLEDRRGRTARYEAYYAGQHRLSFATSRFREAFGNLFSAFADNWCQLVVDASVERLHVTGFRFGDEQQGDDEAWRIWQANDLDGASMLAHTEAVKCGESYLLVSPNDEDPDVPLITVEHPSQVIVAHAPGMRRVRLAALKKWQGDDKHVYATLYLPNTVYRFRSREPVRGDLASRIEWVTRDEAQNNPLGRVPVVPLYNEPSLLGGGMSDLAGVIPLQDACNKLISDMLVASEFAAFRQRWATGIETPRDPETGEALPGKDFLSSVARVWNVEDPEAKFGDFEVTDLGNYVKAIEMIVQHVAAQTRTPPHYLLGQSGAFPSGESLKSTETGLVAKVQRKQVSFSDGYEEAIRLAFLLKGDERRGRAFDAETLWKDPESRTEGEHVDAVLKMASIGVPQEALWERLGASPQEIGRWKDMQTGEAARLGMAGIADLFKPPVPQPAQLNGSAQNS